MVFASGQQPEQEHRREASSSTTSLPPGLYRIGRILLSASMGIGLGRFIQDAASLDYEIGLAISCFLAGAIWELLRMMTPSEA